MLRSVNRPQRRSSRPTAAASAGHAVRVAVSSVALAPVVALTLAAVTLSPTGPPGVDAHPASPPTRPAATHPRSLDPSAGPVRGGWAWPLSPRPPVVRRFVRPSSAYGSGHRGVDLGAHVGQPVRAVAAGTVSHVGVIAGRGSVTVAHAFGLRSTYEPVTASAAVGAAVAAGQVIGTISPAASHCAPRVCLHLGAIRGRDYLDPLSLLRPMRIRLLPVQP